MITTRVGDFSKYILLTLILLSFFFGISYVKAADRSTPFTVGQTLDPGAESSEPCGPTDNNCFPALLTSADEGSQLSANVLHLNFVGAGVSATHSGATTTVTISGGTGLTSLNGSASTTQTFATSTSGTDFSITTAAGVHTFNMPTASASSRGLLSSTDWSTFNSKLANSLLSGYILVGSATNTVSAVALSGDAIISNVGALTIATSSITTNKILDGTIGVADLAANSVDGTKLTLSGEGAGDLMYFNGTDWVRLATSSDGQILSLASGVPTWVASNTLSSISGVLGVAKGGTGTSTTPAAGQLLLGDGAGGYSLVATSSLGITPGIWGSITGTLSSQTDLQSALNARLTLSDWISTTTDALDEGITNLYFTNARADARFAVNLAATTTTALAEGINLYWTNDRFDTRLAATTTTALAEGGNLYFTTARGNANFATNLAATTTTALAEGTNLYWTDNRFDSRLAATTTTALAEGANLYFTNARADARFAVNLAATTTTALAEGTNLYWTNDRFDTRLAATTSLPGLTQLTGLTTVGTSGGTTTVAGNLAVNQGISIASSTPATTTGMLYNLSNTLYWNGSAVGTNVAMNSLSAATAVDTLDNAHYTQTWNWSTATSTNGLTLSASALTTGALLALNTASGDTALSVFGNILPSAAPTQSAATTTGANVSTVASSYDVGGHISTALSTDGTPVIPYFDTTGPNGQLNVVKCGNTDCSSGNTITTVDSASISMGRYTSVAISTDGFPVISYYDLTNGDLRVAKCTDIYCTSTTTTLTTVDDGGANVVGIRTSLAIGTDGLPVISHHDDTSGDLEFVKCGNAACSSGNSTTTLDSTGDVGDFASLAIGTDGAPVISYFDLTNGDLKVIKCGNTACSAGNTITTLDSSVAVIGKHTSLAIGTDGFPVISYYNETDGDLKVMKCGNTSCSSGNSSTTVDTTDDIGQYTSIKLAVDGFPVISYADITNEDLKVLKCGNAACSSGNAIYTPDPSTNPVGTFTAIGISKDGSPYVAHREGGVENIRLVKFNSTLINNLGGQSMFAGGADIGSQVNYFNNVYAAQLWGKRLTVANFDLAENYTVADLTLEAGDVVALNEDGELVKAGSDTAIRTLGVISTAPGLLLSNWEEEGEVVKPVALAGRVPVKVDTNEVVQVGDVLAVSENQSGRVKKANSGEASVGYVIKSLGENQVEMFVKLTDGVDTLVMNFATTTADALSTSTLGQIVSSGAVTLEGRIKDMATIIDTLGSSTAPITNADGDKTFLGRVLDRVAQWLGEAANGIARLFVDEAYTNKLHTNQLCVGETCLTETQLQDLLKTQGVIPLEVGGQNSSSSDTENSEFSLDEESGGEEIGSALEATVEEDEAMEDTENEESAAEGEEETILPEEVVVNENINTSTEEFVEDTVEVAVEEEVEVVVKDPAAPTPTE